MRHELIILLSININYIYTEPLAYESDQFIWLLERSDQRGFLLSLIKILELKTKSLIQGEDVKIIAWHLEVGELWDTLILIFLTMCLKNIT